MFVWTRRIQWLQTRRKDFNENPKNLGSKYKNCKKNKYFRKKVCLKSLLSQCMPCWSLRRSFSRSLREWYKNYFSYAKFSIYFSSIHFYRYEEYSDYKLAEKFSTKVRKNCAQVTKLVKKNIYFKKTVCIKILLHRWMQCWPPRRSFPHSLREWYKNYFSSAKFIFFLNTFL